MSHASLKLVNPALDRDSLFLERRVGNRRPMAGRVTAVRTGNRKQQLSPKICSLQMVDMSDTGMGAVSSEAVETGADITVLFPAHGPDGGYEGRGEVVRCLKRDYGYEVGIRFDNHTSVA